jgi:hypothetical protein
LLSSGAEFFVFQFAIQKYKYNGIYTIMILPVFLYGCENWSPILREERRLKMFENSVLKRIFVSKKMEMIEEWRKLNNEDLNDLYFSPNIFRVLKTKTLKWAGFEASMGRLEVHVGFLVGTGGKELSCNSHA